MEKFVNEIVSKLSEKFCTEDMVKIKEVLFSTLKDYDVVPRKTELLDIRNEIPKELKIYLVSRKIEGLSESTLDQYKTELEKMLLSIGRPITDIATEDIRLYLYKLKNVNNLSDKTLDSRRSYISAFFKWLTNNEYIVRNPCAPIAPFKYEKKVKKALSDIEMEKLRVSCKNVYEKAVLEVLYSTACRVSELVNIKHSDIDYENKEIIIRQGKGNKSRITFLNAKATIAIQEYIKDRDYSSTYLFEASKNPHNRLSSRSIEKTCHSLEERTGIRLYPHKIRRTTATNLWKKGMPLEEIKELLGHDDLSTTLIYTNVDSTSVKSDHQKYM